MVDVLNEERSTKRSSLSSLRQTLTDEVRLNEKTPSDLNIGKLESILEQLSQQLDLRIENLGQLVEKTLEQQHFRSRASFNTSQMNKSNESPDPGGGNLISRSPLVEQNRLDLRKTQLPQNSMNGSTVQTGNLARIKDNRPIKNEFTNQTAEKSKFFSQLFNSVGLTAFNGELDGSEKNKLFYTNAMIAIISAGFAMLFVNVVVLVLGYKCIQRRRVSKRADQRSKENLNSKENLSTIPGQVSQLINSSLNSNTIGTFGYGRALQNGNLIGNSIVESGRAEKCYCGGQFCNCANEVDKLQLLNSDSSFFTTDTLITDHQPLSHLVSPVCKLINTENYESPDMIKINLQSSPSINDQLINLNENALTKQYSSNMTNSHLTNSHLTSGHLSNSLSSNQLSKEEESNLNCDCITANAQPMLAVLDSTGDSNLLTEAFGEFSTIGCESNLYKFFESNYYTPYDPNGISSTAALQAQQSNSSHNGYQTSIPNTLTLFGTTTTNTVGPTTTEQQSQHLQSAQLHSQLRAHAPQTIQLQLLTEHLLNTPTSQPTTTTNN